MIANLREKYEEVEASNEVAEFHRIEKRTANQQMSFALSYLNTKTEDVFQVFSKTDSILCVVKHFLKRIFTVKTFNTTVTNKQILKPY